jgi:hypothetical protein
MAGGLRWLLSFRDSFHALALLRAFGLRLAAGAGVKGGVMDRKHLIVSAVIAASLGGCYAYAGPPRHAHPRRERVVVVEHRRPAPVVVHERVVVRHRHHRY